MANWQDKFNTLASNKLELEGNKEWRFAVEEDKNKGTIQLNARLFSVATEEGKYSGPTKSGFIYPINSLEDIEKLRNAFNEMFDNAAKLFNE